MLNNKDLKTPIFKIDDHLWIKREDFIPFSFGGNKARKAYYFLKEYEKGNYNCIVTYGSSSSNHCRIIANIAASKRIPCYIISPLESSETTFNSRLVDFFGVSVFKVHINDVSRFIEELMSRLKSEGKNPFFIQGGGHGNIGTQAYVDCYKEIVGWEKENNIIFDYIFLASGTGTTQAGLVCGNIMNKDNHTIVGISIARQLPRGRNVILDSIRDYLGYSSDLIDKQTIFIDDYLSGGYGKHDEKIDNIIKEVMRNYGIPLDTTYTGKAFYGMVSYLKENEISGKNILFLHTGGTPLFFSNNSWEAK